MQKTDFRGNGPEPHPPQDDAQASVMQTLFGVMRRFRAFGGAEFPRGLPTRGARRLELVSLGEALARRWDDDRHVVLYTASHPYRINNAALGTVTAEMRILALDVDNHDKAPGWLEGERPKIAALVDAHPGGFVHTTRGGWRALFALPPFRIHSTEDKDRFALFYARMAAYMFDQFGIVVDDALTRWNQPVRLPHVVREGHVFDAEILAGSPETLAVFSLPEGLAEVPNLRPLAHVLPRWGGVAKRWQPVREVLRVASAAYDHVPLPPYADRLAAAGAWAREEAPRAVQRQGGRATARSVGATLRVGFALEREDVAHILTGPYNRRRCSPPWGELELEDLRGIASTVAQAPRNAWGFMLSRDRTGVEVARATLAAAGEARRVVPLDEISGRLHALMDQHRALVVRATYGAGKTFGAADYVATRTSGRVVVVVPTHELGRTWVEALGAFGETRVAYHASVVKRTDDRGEPHCDNRIALRLYKEGGDVARDVCPGCPRAETCPAYTALPPGDARVQVVPREMIPKANVTDEDLVVFDDAAVDLLEWHRLGERDLRRLRGVDTRMLPAAQARLVSPFVEALLSGPRASEDRARTALDGGEAPFPSPLPQEAFRALAERLVQGQRSPHIPREALRQDEDDLTETLRDVGRLRRLLRFASALAAGEKVHWSDGARSVHGESPAAALLRSHAGRLVVLDASANVEELHALRPDLHVERLDVHDAGDVRRVLLFAKDATRSALRDDKARARILDEWLTGALAELDARGAKRPVLVAYKSLVPDLRGHPLLAAWRAAEPGRSVKLAHYGALRGSNRFQRRDSVVTLGDPWLNGDDVTGRAQHLALDEPSYRIALATAELGQAHGRSRSVRRAVPITLVHVGRLVPDGWGQGVDVGPLGGPPERSHGTADRMEFGALVGALGGNRGAAAALGCSSSAVAKWRCGVRGLPRTVLDQARTLVTALAPPTVSSGEAGRGAPSLEMDPLPYKKIPRGWVHGSDPPSSPAEETVACADLGDGLKLRGTTVSPVALPEPNPLLALAAPLPPRATERLPDKRAEQDSASVLVSLPTRSRAGRSARRSPPLRVIPSWLEALGSFTNKDASGAFEDDLSALAATQARVRRFFGLERPNERPPDDLVSSQTGSCRASGRGS